MRLPMHLQHLQLVPFFIDRRWDRLIAMRPPLAKRARAQEWGWHCAGLATQGVNDGDGRGAQAQGPHKEQSCIALDVAQASPRRQQRRRRRWRQCTER